MDCISFWVWIASGVVIVPLMAWLKTLPQVGAIVEQWAFLIAPLLSALAPVIASAASPLCGKIDPLAWTFIYAGAVYLISQIVYWTTKKAGVKV